MACRSDLRRRESDGGASKLAAVQNDVPLAGEAATVGHGAVLLGWCDQPAGGEAAAGKYRPIPDSVAQIRWADALYDAHRAAIYYGSGQDQGLLNATTADFDHVAAELQAVTSPPGCTKQAEMPEQLR